MNFASLNQTHGVDGTAKRVYLLIGIPDQNLRRGLTHHNVDAGGSQILLENETFVA